MDHSKYKTRLCKTWERNGTCHYGEHCQFAHGHKELKDIRRHPPPRRRHYVEFKKRSRSPHHYHRQHDSILKKQFETLLLANENLIFKAILDHIKENVEFRDKLRQHLEINELENKLEVWAKDYDDFKDRMYCQV